MDQTILAALRAALDTNSDNTALRLHLASLLLEAGDAGESLEHCAFVLGREPDNIEALQKASKAAAAAGDNTRAESYSRLVEALAWKRTKGLIDSIGEGMEFDLPTQTSLDEVADWVPEEEQRIPVGRTCDGGDEEATTGFWEMEQPDITLADVAGMEEVKRRLNIAFLAPMKNPEMMRLYGKSLRGGLLLYGPPGCGKTYIARATAGELGARFLSIGLSDVLDMWFGQSEKNLHEIFETARRNRPCVLFFDEIDALGRKRSLMRESGGRDVVNQLLAEMDSVQGNNEGVFVLAATNHPWDVDTALRRPGRLDRTLLVLPPDTPARHAILASQMRDRPAALDLDFYSLATRTEGFSGADMAHLCESAAELAMEDSMLTGNVRPIAQADFQRALREIKPSVRPWFDTARNYALFANEGGAYDELAKYLRANNLM